MRKIAIASIIVTITAIASIFTVWATPFFVLSLVSFILVVNIESKEFGDWIKVINVNFPRPLRWIGGFITAIAPGFAVMNKRWVKNKSKAAVLHEKMHLELLFKDYWIIYFFILIFIVSIFVLSFELPSIIKPFIYGTFLAFFEYKTNRAVEKKFHISPDAGENHVYYYGFYVLLYSSWFLLINMILGLIP